MVEMRPRVNTTKHYQQTSLESVASGAVRSIQEIFAVVNLSRNLPSEVREGAIISAIYLEMWVQSDDATQGSVICTVEKLQSGATNPSAGDMAALHTYDNKKNILYTQMGLIGNNVAYPSAVVKGWFKIPKSKQRFGLGDKLIFTVFAQTNGLTLCGFATYKEQF